MTSENLPGSLVFTLFKRIADLEEEKSELQEEVNSQLEQIRRLQNELSDEKSEKKQLQEVLEEAIGMVDHFKQKNCELQANCLIYTQENRNLQTNLSDAQRKVETLEFSLCDANEEICRYDEKDEELNNYIDDCLETIEELKEENLTMSVMLEKNLADSHNQITDLENKLEIVQNNCRIGTIEPFDPEFIDEWSKNGHPIKGRLQCYSGIPKHNKSIVELRLQDYSVFRHRKSSTTTKTDSKGMISLAYLWLVTNYGKC